MRTLSELGAEAAGCRRCPLAETRTKVVFGTGNEKADLMLVGEAPGQREDRGPPVGQAGMLSTRRSPRRLRREDICIPNVLKCALEQPRSSRRSNASLPRRAAPRSWPPRVLAPMKLALNLFSPKGGHLRGPRQDVPVSRDGGDPDHHPAAILYRRTLEPDLVEDFRKIVSFLKSGEKVEREPDQLSLF
jgi:DNA polymerase